jgi:hypothetical protein
VTRDDDRASLSSIAKTSPGCRGSISSLWELAKGCLHGPRERYGIEPYVNRAWKVCGVLIVFSPVVCTSIQITATLGYEYRLFVAVIM